MGWNCSLARVPLCTPDSHSFKEWHLRCAMLRGWATQILELQNMSKNSMKPARLYLMKQLQQPTAYDNLNLCDMHENTAYCKYFRVCTDKFCTRHMVEYISALGGACQGIRLLSRLRTMFCVSVESLYYLLASHMLKEDKHVLSRIKVCSVCHCILQHCS